MDLNMILVFILAPILNPKSKPEALAFSSRTSHGSISSLCGAGEWVIA